MSLLKPGFGVAALSGKLGGNVYARNRGGLYVRSLGTTVQPETPDQVDKMDIWISFSDTYNGFSKGTIDAWRDYASQLTKTNRIGEVKKPQARNVYCEIYTNLSLCGGTIITEPSEWTNRPAIQSMDDVEVTTDDIELQGYDIIGPHCVIPSGDKGGLLISTSPITKPSIRNVNNQYRLIITASGTSSLIHAQSAYEGKFSDYAKEGDIAHTKLRVIDRISGLGSTPFVIETTVVQV